MGRPIGERRDLNERELVDFLRKEVGASVEQLTVVDLLVGYGGRNYLLEVKRPGQVLSPSQAKWHARWSGQVSVVRSREDVCRALGIDMPS